MSHEAPETNQQTVGAAAHVYGRVVRGGAAGLLASYSPLYGVGWDETVRGSLRRLRPAAPVKANVLLLTLLYHFLRF